RLVLGVHEHAVPAVQDDRVVIRVADGALRPDVRVSDHLAPATTPPLALREPQPIVDGDATRVRVVHEHRLAAVADGGLEDVVLAAAPRERLVLKDGARGPPEGPPPPGRPPPPAPRPPLPT